MTAAKRRRAIYYYVQYLKWERILNIYPANCSNWPFQDITRREAEAMQKIRSAHLPYFIKQLKNNRQ
jgi:hypothetical protein